MGLTVAISFVMEDVGVGESLVQVRTCGCGDERCSLYGGRGYLMVLNQAL